MKYYAVKAGKTTGIFSTWSDCQDSVKGFSNPDFKSFDTEEEAKAYLGGTDIYRERVKGDIKNGLLVAFCDGSFDEMVKKYAYGVIIIDREGGSTNCVVQQTILNSYQVKTLWGRYWVL